ncbi:pyroglutamyl peptidase [Streptomyces sp. NPDC059991]|uniref:pyroglutamyl-peptidase I family protein n=1 Tax=unclassified Streptomyces TaxID=2593676 RepID=UPI00367748B2
MTFGAVLVPVPAQAQAPAATGAPPTVEEQRLDLAVPQEILRRSGFDDVAGRFARELDGVRSYREAERLVAREGAALWRRAVDRAQGRGPAGGDLSRDDDRPLYWARLGMTRELRGWEPGFGLSQERRAALLDRLERGSRGQNSITYGSGTGYKRILVTGFDPFTLDRDIRISNPSGATALALDGTWIRTAAGPARIETAMFPVRWDDFAAGTVERTLRPVLPQVDLFTTVSQGRFGRIDVERFNGAWRGGFPDNENESRTEQVPVSDPASQPQWTRTTLPYQAIVAARTGPYPVYDHTSVTEVPAGGTGPVVREDGPSAGSVARAGGGGDYLSNEIAYRATLLRDRLGLSIPGGHVHTPVLEFGAGNTDPSTGAVTDAEFERNRGEIVGQVRAIVTTAVSPAPPLS